MKNKIGKMAAGTLTAVAMVLSSATPALADGVIEFTDPRGRVVTYGYTGERPSEDYVSALQEMEYAAYWKDKYERRIADNAGAWAACGITANTALGVEVLEKLDKKTGGSAQWAKKLKGKFLYTGLLCAEIAYLSKDDEHYLELYTKEYERAMARVCSIPVRDPLCNCW